jgi:protein required for attachment to host cells
MKPTRTWILIADGARARILVNEGPGKGVTPLEGGTFESAHDASHALGDDKPGRTFESATTARHAYEPSQDPHRELKRDFAAELAAMLDQRLLQKDYDRVILVAPPKMLGDLRAELTEAVRAVLYAELDKDLTKTPVKELPGHLGAVLAV